MCVDRGIKNSASPTVIAARLAARAIPPLWPLSSSVAVNPFLGQTDEALAIVGARLSRVAGCAVTMPREWYKARLSAGEMTDADLSAALDAAPSLLKPSALPELQACIDQPSAILSSLPTIADLASSVSGIDWPGIIADRIGAWAAAYFDEGQALWSAGHGMGAHTSWRSTAVHDLTPEILGLRGFAHHVARSPENANAAIIAFCDRIALPGPAQHTYFHQLLMTMGGWAQLARYKLWLAEQHGNEDNTLTDMLAIRLCWEVALFDLYKPALELAWQQSCDAHAQPIVETQPLVVDAILQDALERSFQRRLAEQLDASTETQPASPPALQVAFCIDVRSEVFRRKLEACDARIQTLGFAGFFGLGTSHHALASDVEELRLPVLLTPGLSSRATATEEAIDAVRVPARAKRAWGRFKLAAVSSFSFVEATGLVYVAKLLRDALGLRIHRAAPDPRPDLDPLPGFAVRIDIAEAVLRGMSLTNGFARLVILCGHGASTVNNPHASALHCGACGGYAGDVNSRLLAGLLNDPDVRQGLAMREIAVPSDTFFVGALHDTTTDQITFFADDHASPRHATDVVRAEAWFAAAGKATRLERAGSLPRAQNARRLFKRSRDWAEVRPEWGLAGCRAFIAAPRARTAGKDLGGRAFLHDYSWQRDKGFGVLELILTAPVLVASWISLQYYGSTVAPNIMGAGNKLLHNVCGGVTVIEGNGGSALTGLPFQSVHDGADFVHQPMRLSVCIEAPRDAITSVLTAHRQVQQLFDNGWMHLFALDEEGRMAWRYRGDLKWERAYPPRGAETEPAIAQNALAGA